MKTDIIIQLFGLNSKVVRPEWMILTILPIPPVTMRPSITLESGERSEDDLTHKLGDVVRINQRLFENINAGAPEIIIEDLWDLLQYHVTTFFDNNVKLPNLKQYFLVKSFSFLIPSLVNKSFPAILI